MPDEVAITVLMPAFNAARWLPAAIGSVLAQSAPSFELLIIDDGSTDETPALLGRIADPRVRWLRHAPNRGLVAALNLGLSEARGEYVARLDADDLCLPDRLARQQRRLDGDPDTVLVSGWSRLIDERGKARGRSRWRLPPEALYYLLHFRNCISHSTVMFRRDSVLALGGYRESYRHAEDFELWARLSALGRKLVYLPEYLIAQRVHPGSISVRQATPQQEMSARIAGEQLARLLRESISTALPWLYAERSLDDFTADELTLAASQLARAQAALWRHRPRHCRDPVLRHFMQVEWSRRAHSLSRRGIHVPPAPLGDDATAWVEGKLRGALDELHVPRVRALLPRTHP